MKIIIIKKISIFACYFEKVDAELLGEPPKFQVTIEIQLNTAHVSRLSFRFLCLCFYLILNAEAMVENFR